MKRFLVVDDDANIRNALRDLFAVFYPEATVAFAADGQQGLEHARHMNPDLILLDLNLPVLGGTELIAQLRCLPDTSQIPLMVMSAINPWDARVQELSTRCDAMIFKPFDVDTLFETLASVVH